MGLHDGNPVYQVVSRDLGAVTAYAAAVNRGYTGTKEEFETLMASYASVAQQAAESAGNASQSATDASQSATDAETAKGTAQQAATDAQTAQASAQDYAQSASQSAQSASQYAQSAESAKDTAVDAVDGFASGAQQALDSVNQAGINWKSLAQAKALDSEAWAVGQRDGEDVGSSDPAYHNNAKYYAEQGGTSAQTATEAAQTATQKASDAQASASAAAESARTLTIDATLTKEGQAAGAKETGDKIRAIGDNFETRLFGENLVDSEQLEEGYYYSRGVKTASAALTSAWIDVEDIDVINASGRKLSDSAWSGVEMYYICAYDENKTYIPDSMVNTGVKQFTVPDGAKYLAVSYVNSTYSEFTVVAGTKRPGRYIHSNRKTVLSAQHYGIWSDKTWAALGDSLTEYNFRSPKNYIEYIVENTGISAVNLGVSGTGYRRGINNSNSFYNRVNTIPNDCDVLTIFGSINDIGGGQTLGTINDDISNDTVFGYVNATLNAIYTAIPSINIGIISPTPWKDSRPWDSTESASKYSEGLKQICYNRGIPFLDLYHCSNLRPWDATARDLFYSKDLVDGVNAGCHPDSNGHKMIAPKIEAFLETLLM